MERSGGSPFQPRRVRLAAVSRPRVDGDVHVTQGQTLTSFLDSRRHFLSLTQAVDEGSAEAVSHLAVRMDSILWVRSLDARLALGSPLNHPSGRPAELMLADGERLRAELLIAADQRLTDYLDVPPFFLPVHAVRVVATGEDLGELALNTRAIYSIRELVEEPRRRSRNPDW